MYRFLFYLISEYNLECYQITVKLKKNEVIIYYLDLETPIVFIPLQTNEIDNQTFKRVSTISKVIKSNLSLEFNQELEVRFIQVSQYASNKDPSFKVFKIEDQRMLFIINIIYHRILKKSQIGQVTINPFGFGQ